MDIDLWYWERKCDCRLDVSAYYAWSHGTCAKITESELRMFHMPSENRVEGCRGLVNRARKHHQSTCKDELEAPESRARTALDLAMQCR